MDVHATRPPRPEATYPVRAEDPFDRATTADGTVLQDGSLQVLRCGKDLRRMALLCRHHHTVTHRRDWQMGATEDQWFFWFTPSGRRTWSQRHGRSRPDPASGSGDEGDRGMPADQAGTRSTSAERRP